MVALFKSILQGKQKKMKQALYSMSGEKSQSSVFGFFTGSNRKIKQELYLQAQTGAQEKKLNFKPNKFSWKLQK